MNYGYDTLPQHYANFDVKLAWDAKTSAEGIVIEGCIQNIRYALMENIEIWVTLRDADGTKISRSADYVSRLNLNDTAPFCVTLPMTLPSGGNLLFTYKYQGSDGGEGTNWMQSFESDL